MRGLFLIDPKGIIRHVTCNDLPVGRDVGEAIRVLEGFIFIYVLLFLTIFSIRISFISFPCLLTNDRVAFQFHEANPDLVW